MESVRARTDIEGAVIYLEREDDTPVGLVKIKSDHYVIARRTRETMKSALVNVVVKKQSSVDDALKVLQQRLKKGMAELEHVGGCKEHNKEWAEHAIAFGKSWASAYKGGNSGMQRALETEFRQKYGSLYQRFWTTKN